MIEYVRHAEIIKLYGQVSTKEKITLKNVNYSAFLLPDLFPIDATDTKNYSTATFTNITSDVLLQIEFLNTQNVEFSILADTLFRIFTRIGYKVVSGIGNVYLDRIVFDIYKQPDAERLFQKQHKLDEKTSETAEQIITRTLFDYFDRSFDFDYKKYLSVLITLYGYVDSGVTGYVALYHRAGYSDLMFVLPVVW